MLIFKIYLHDFIVRKPTSESGEEFEDCMKTISRKQNKVAALSAKINKKLPYLPRYLPFKLCSIKLSSSFDVVCRQVPTYKPFFYLFEINSSFNSRYKLTARLNSEIRYLSIYLLIQFITKLQVPILRLQVSTFRNCKNHNRHTLSQSSIVMQLDYQFYIVDYKQLS